MSTEAQSEDVLPIDGETILVLTPTGRDADLACSLLQQNGMHCHRCSDAVELAAGIRQGAGLALLAEEALTTGALRTIAVALTEQPRWSDIPVLIFTAKPSMELAAQSLEKLDHRANVTLVDRPVRVNTLLSTVRAALRARERQYALRDAFNELQNRIEERDRFLAILGHELRNPLAAILLAVQTIVPDDHDSVEEQREVVERQARHLSRLVADLLEVSRVASGKIKLKRTPVDLRPLVEHCIATIQDVADARRITIENRIEEEMWVDGDSVRLEQIVGNLLTNAIKYNVDGGSVTIAAKRSGDHVRVEVSDSGVGMDDATLHSIFDLFAQAENTLDRSEGGLGIGLTLVRSLTELHGGSIEAFSDGPNSGSRFIVTLPAAAPLRPAVPDSANIDGSRNGHRRIAIVEDNVDVRRLLSIRLRRAGHEVEAFPDGRSGCDGIIAMKPDVAIVDIGLPELDGFGVARAVREALGDEIVLIALSGYGQPEDRSLAISSGFDAHLTKPIDSDQLNKILQRMSRHCDHGSKRP